MVNERSMSEYGLFDSSDEVNENDKVNAGYIDEWASFFDLPQLNQDDSKPEPVPLSPEPLSPPPIMNNVSESSKKLSLMIPSIPKPSEQHQITNNSSIKRNEINVIKTKKDMKREYRQTIAIPRYLAKRSRRKWDKELMHPSRSIAAQRRARNGGQFGVVDAKFTPCESSSS
jgi:hypothetical protein